MLPKRSEALNDQVPGNAEVIKILETCLEKAWAGDINYIAATLTQGNPNRATAVYGGAADMEGVAKQGIGILEDKLEASILNRTLPERTELGADYACYNVAMAPLSFDFLAWLIYAEMTRVREGAPAPLKVAFWFGRDGNSGLSDSNRKTMLNQVARPALALLGAVEDDRALGGRFQEVYVLRQIVDAVKAGEPAPIFRASQEAHEEMAAALGNDVPITITLRETHYWMHRNSNMKAWTQFAADLQERGEKVVFVRDTCKAFQPLRGFRTCPAASMDLNLRMALYERAKMNLFVSNGPSMLAFFSEKPWRVFWPAHADGHQYTPQTETFLREHMGMNPGDQFPWSGPDQRLMWGVDSYENILAAGI